MNVLIAGGDSVARLDLRTRLADLGHTTTGEADTGPKTLVLARNLRPDLLLLDAEISLSSGIDVAQTLFDEGIAPSILLTDAMTPELLDRLDRSGLMGVLTKPLRSSDLGPMLLISVARWRRMAELDTEVRALNERMEARKLVGRAKAILMEKFGLQERDAFRRIQAQSAAMNRPVHEIARAIITAHDVSV